MTCSKVYVACLVIITYLLYVCHAADLIAPNTLPDGGSMQEGDWVLLNQECSLSLSKNGEVRLRSQGIEGTCTLTMREDGELVEARDSDGEVAYSSETASVTGGAPDSYKLHLGGDGQLAIERGDSSVILELNPAS
ncbi:hypothetical protein Mapa_006951 [Marchantia paleacea]|nr:hypothetical protein Mapa_006951 [Marchantia paleacea]